MNPRFLFSVLWNAGTAWVDDRAPRIGAALAFYTALSLAPILVISLALAGRVYGEEAARGQIVEQIREVVGEPLAATIQSVLANAKTPPNGKVTLILGLITLFFGATGVFGELQEGINDIWKVRPKSGRPVWTFFRSRFLSFGMVLGIGFLLVVSMAFSIGLDIVERYTAGLLPGSASFLAGVNFVLIFALEALLFAMIFKVLPDARLHWRDVMIGALVTTALFTLGKYLIGLYLWYGGVGMAFGAAGSVVVFLVWVYYTTQILLYGAEVTKVYAARAGRHIAPAAGAESVPTAD